MHLSGLDAVDWTSLTHAYGPAKTTAAELQSLTSEDAQERAHAYAALTASICHQGSVYPATAAAVPFLSDVATDESLPRDSRMSVLALLGWIAEGSANMRRWHPDSVTEAWVRELESNLRGTAARILDLARSADDAEVRAWAVWFIREAPPNAEDLDSLRGCLIAERDAVVRATIALGLPRDDDTQSELIDARENPLVRLCAAARLIPVAADVASLVAIAEQCVPRSGRFGEMPDVSQDTSPVRLIALSLGMVSPARQVEWITRWLHEGAYCSEALYAASEGGAARRSVARLLIEPVRTVLTHPPSKEHRSTAAFALVELGLPGVEQLQELAHAADSEVQQTARQYLSSAETLIQVSRNDPRRNPTSDLRPPADLAATLIAGKVLDASNTQVTTALNELAAWGPRARDQASAVAAVVERGNSGWIRAHAEWALAQVTGNDRRLVSQLIKELEPGWPAFLAVRMLAELGPVAAAALPILRGYVERDLRPPDLDALQDDLLINACLDAISQVESGPDEG